MHPTHTPLTFTDPPHSLSSHPRASWVSMTSPDLLLCQTRSRCDECRWSGPTGCGLLASLEAATPVFRPPRPDPDGGASPFAWSDAGLVFDGGIPA